MGTRLAEADPILYALGGRSKYQIVQYALVRLASLSTAFQLLNFVFVGRSIEHTCTAPDNLTDIFNHINDDRFSLNTSSVEFGECNIRVTSNISGTPETTSLNCIYGYTFEERQDLSVISDMEVVCDREALKGLGQTLLILGQGIGAMSLPIFSDRYGRRPVHLISHFLMLLIGVGVAFSPNYLVFLVLRTFLGIAQQGVVLTQSTYAIEMFPAKHRKLGAFMSSCFWCVCTSLIALIGFLGQYLSWRNLQLAYCCVSLYVLVQYFIIDESLRWLTANGKDKEIVKSITKAAKFNGKEVDDVMKVYKRLKLEAERKEEEEKTLLAEDDQEKHLHAKKENIQKESMLDLLKQRRLAFNVAILWFIWMTDSMTYFGMFMTAHSLSGSRFLNFFLFTLVKFPSSVLEYNLVDRFGRRTASKIFHSTAGIALIAATVVHHIGGESHWAETPVTVLSCIGVFGISGAWGCSFFLTPEMFPTNLRNFGLGTCSSFSRIGGMMAPFASLLADYVSWAPGAIFGTCCMTVSVLVHMLPETRGRELPQTLQDLQNWYRKDEKEPKMADTNGTLIQRKFTEAA